MDEKKKKDAPEEPPRVVKCPADLQRIRLERLMKNPEKPVIIPERPKERSMTAPPDFVRNVMGSSAGAGSGEFHVYRHLRRKEIARQKFIQEKSKRETLDEQYHSKLEEYKKLSAEKTAKKRAKRLKKKEKAKAKGKKPKIEKADTDEKSEESSDDEANANTDGEQETNVENDESSADKACKVDKTPQTDSTSENNGTPEPAEQESKSDDTENVDKENAPESTD